MSDPFDPGAPEDPDVEYEYPPDKPWIRYPKTLKRVRPPVPELGWCARCQCVNPRPGLPADHDGHDWVIGLDRCAYVAGVICPECLSDGERRKVEGARLHVLVYGDEDDSAAIFIDPTDEEEDI